MRLQDHPDHDRETTLDRPLEVNHFRMLVPESGYCWLRGATPSPDLGDQKQLGRGPYMAVQAFVEPNSLLDTPAREYFPLIDTPDLFRRFRDLELDSDALLSFANQYGWLGASGKVDYGERCWISAVGISRWQSEIQSMIVADHLFQCVETDDRRTLRPYFKWHETKFDVRLAVRLSGRGITALPAQKVSAGPWGEWLVMPGQIDCLKELAWHRDDVLGPARLALMNIVNERLEALCHPRLYLDAQQGFIGHWIPVNLLGCIWLQFYLKLLGQLKLRRCVLCGIEMDVTDSRSTRKMHDRCSRNQRQSRWREKVRRKSESAKRRS